MSSSEIVLQNFVLPLPACQYGSTWEEVLHALKISDCGTVAIIDGKQNVIGTIDSNRALALLVQNRDRFAFATQDCTATVGINSELCTNSRGHFLPEEIEYDSLLEPVSVIESNTDWRKLLNRIRQDSLRFCHDRDYIVVDGEGQIVGLLDIRNLANFFLCQSPIDSPATDFLNLLESIDLPLMLKADNGKIVYGNSCWQKLLKDTNISQELLPISSLGDDYCLKGNYYLEPATRTASLMNSIPREWDLETAKKLGWKYITLPLKRGLKLQYPHNSSICTSLILATRHSPEEASNTNKASKFNNLQDYLLANVSHELRSPLMGIVGLSNLLAEEKIGKLNQRQINYVELIQQSGYKSIDIVSNLLELTNLIQGKTRLNLETVDLGSLCQQAYQRAKEKLQKERDRDLDRDNNFRVEINSHFNHKLFSVSEGEAIADKSYLTQILAYLLENALEYGAKSGDVGIKVEIWQERLAFTVWDEGILSITSKIRASFLSRLQSEAYLQNERSEIDLEAILIQQLIKAHGGSISLVPQLQKKNEITLLLPHKLSPLKSEIVSARDTRSESSSLVLLVVNNSNYIKKVRSAIADLGYDSLVARNGTEAIQKARQSQPSYILLDPALPVLSAADVLTLLKSDARTQDIPVFIINSEPTARLSSQVNGFIPQPWEEMSLARILPSVDRERSAPPQKQLTILCLYPEPEEIAPITKNKNSLDFNLKDWAEQDWTLRNTNDRNGINKIARQNYYHRIIEADGLEQAEMLARIWQLDAIVLDSGQLRSPEAYLRSLAAYPELNTFPLITLDASSTAAANQIEELNVYPCLVPPECRSIADLMEVIQIATGFLN